MKRKFLAALLALVMVFSMIPVSASAKEAKDTDKGVTFEYSDTTLSGLYGTFTVTALAPDGTQYSQITVSDFYKSGSQKNTWTINSDTYEIASISLSNGVLSSHSISENKHSVDFRCTFTQDSSTLTVQLAEHFDESQVAIEGEEIKHNGIFYYDISEVEALKMVGKSLNWQLPDSITIDGITLRYVQTNVLQPTEGFTKLDGYYENGYIDYWEADAQNGSGLATPYNIRQIEIRYNDTETAIIPYTDLKYVRVANRTSRYEIQSNDASHSIVAFYNEAESDTGNDYSLYAVRFVETGNSIGKSKMPPDPKYADHLYYEFTGWTIGYNGGAPFHENTTVTDDTVVYAQKKTTTSTSSEIHVMNENGELINRYIELFNASHPGSSITAESIDMGSIKITVYGQGDEHTNPDYNLSLEQNGWREEDSYYFVYNYLSGVGEQDNTPIAVNEITKIVIDAKDTDGNTLDPVTINRGSANGEFDATTGAGGASGYIIELYIKAAPTAPTDDELLDDPDIDGDLAILGENAVKVTCTNNEAEHKAQTYGLIANTNGQTDSYTIGAVTALADGGYTCTITVNNEPYVAEYGENHTLAENEPESQNIVLTWDSDSNTWIAPSELPVNFNVTCTTEPGGGDEDEPNVPTDDELKAALSGMIQVDCITNEEQHLVESYGVIDGGINRPDPDEVTKNGETYTYTVTVDSAKYLGKYSSEYGNHELVSTGTITITLQYDAEKETWYVDTPVTIEVKCDSGTTDPEKPDEDAVIKLLGNEAVLVQCDVADSGHARRYYPLLSGTFTIGDVENNTVKVTVDSNEYLKEYTLYSGKEHSEVIAQDEHYFTLTWSGSEWTVSGAPVTFTVHCSTSEEPEKPAAPDVVKLLGTNAVEVLCVTNNSVHGSKTYGLLDGGYMEQGPEWIQGEEDGYWQYVVTIDAGFYQAQFNTDTKSKHDLASPAETYLPITLIYRDNTWVIEGTEPYTTIKLVCDSEEPTLPEKPDDETIYDIFNGNKPVILACVTENSGHEEQAFDLLTNSYDIGEVKEIDGRYLCDITIVNVQDYIDIYNENTDKEHSLSPNQPNQVLTLKYADGEWAIDDDGTVYYTVACEDTSTEPTPDPDPTPDPTPTPGPGGGDKPPYIPPVDPDDSGVSDLLNTDDHIQYLFGYPEGTFGPENNMTRAEVAQMFYNLLLDQDVTITKTFDDVPAGAWYAKAVNTLASLGVVSGVGNGDFEPERSITRAEFTSIAMKFAEGKTGGTNIFSDVKSTDWFYRAVVNSTQYGWIHGYGDGTFRPNNPITRVEVTAIVNNMLGREADVDFVTEHYDELNHFSDLEVSHWGYYHIVEATNDHDYTKPSSGENWTELN